MITVMIHSKIKSKKLGAFIEIAEFLTKETKRNPECITYKFNQRRDNPTEFILYEQWKNQKALDLHIENLSNLLGAPEPGGKLPKKLLDMYEKVNPIYYKEILENA